MADHTEVDSFAKFVSEMRDDLDILLKSRGKTVSSGFVDLPGDSSAAFDREFKTAPNVVISASGYVYDGQNPESNYKTVPINVALGRISKTGFRYTVVGPLAGGVTPPWGAVNRLYWIATEG